VVPDAYFFLCSGIDAGTLVDHQEIPVKLLLCSVAVTFLWLAGAQLLHILNALPNSNDDFNHF
jgi:hypothetical protein